MNRNRLFRPPAALALLAPMALLAPLTLGVPLFGDSPAPEAAPSESGPVVEVRNGRSPLEGVVTAGQPTPEQFTAFAEAGFRTVVNLRTDGEKGTWDEAAAATELGLRYIHLPVAGREGLSEDNARTLAAILEEPENLPVLVHCGSSNRVGALFAVKALHVDGLDAEAALSEGKKAGLTSMEPVVREILGLPAEP